MTAKLSKKANFPTFLVAFRAKLETFGRLGFGIHTVKQRNR